MWMALLPFIYPITCETEYFGRNRDQHMHMIDHQVPLPNLAFLVARQLSELAAQVLAERAVERLRRYFGMNTTWYLHSHFV